MPDLDSAIDELRRFAASPPSPPPDLDRIMGRVRSRGRQRRAALVGVLTAVIVGAALVVVHPGSTDPSNLETASEPGGGTPPSDPVALPTGSLISSQIGIAQVGPQSMAIVHDRPTALAFNVGGSQLVAQADAAPDGTDVPSPTGPILVVQDGEITEISPGSGEQIRLLDAAMVEGRPTALATVRRGSTPEDTEEELVRIDIESGDTTSVGVVGGWESGVFQARFAGSHIVTHLSAEASTFVVVRGLDGSVKWQVPGVIDTRVTLTIMGDEVLVLQPGFAGDPLEPQMTVDRYDLATGEAVGSSSITLDLASELDITSGYCSYAEAASGRLYCDRDDGRPIEIDLETGATRAVAGVDSGRVTLPRALPSQGEQPEPCEGDEILSADLDADGRSDRVFGAWVDDDGQLTEAGTGHHQLRACTASGVTAQLSGVGNGEAMSAVDIDGDGRAELLVGGSSISASYFNVVVLTEGRLEQVFVAADPLMVRSGSTPQNSATGLPTETAALGCEDMTGDGQSELVQVTASFTDSEVYWTKQGYTIDGATASGSTPEVGIEPFSGDRLTFAASLITPCAVLNTR